MRNRLYNYICVLVLLEISQPSIYYAKVINDTRRIKREISEISQSKGGTDYAKQVHGVNLVREGRVDGGDLGDDTYLGETSKRSANRANTVPQRSNAGKFIDDTIGRNLGSMEESDYGEEADVEADEEDPTKRERDKAGTNDRVRLPRDANAGDDLDKYTDRDEGSSLYDDYETKDVAKRGVPGGPGDYEEAEENSPETSEDTAAIAERDSTMNDDENEEGKTRNDARVKRDRAVSVTLNDKAKSSADDTAKKLEEEPRTAAEDPNSRRIPRTESPVGFNEASASNEPEIKGSGSNDGATSRLSDSTREIKEPASAAASSEKDELSSAEYEKRAEDEIQRKIDSMKEEIKRDVEAQQRVRDIEENNARFDELRERERDEERSFEGATIEKRRAVAKRSIREVAADTAGVSTKRNEKKSPKGEQRKKQQRRSNETGGSDTLKENENPKGRFATKRDGSSGPKPSQGLFKKKRERVRQTFLISNDRAKRTPSRSYFQTNDKTASLSGEDANNEGGRDRATADNPVSLVSLAGSSQELSPRLAREYKEAFGGLQSEPGGALARFKRIKRVLAADDPTGKFQIADEARDEALVTRRGLENTLSLKVA